MLERNEPARSDRNLLSGRCLPEYLPIERTGLHIKRTLETEEVCGGKVEGLIVDVQPDDLAVRHTHDGLARLGKPVGFFSVYDRPCFVEPVHEGSSLKGGSPFLEVPTHSEVTVAQGEERFALRQETRIKPLLDQLPVFGRIDVFWREPNFPSDHRSSSSHHMKGSGPKGSEHETHGLPLATTRFSPRGPGRFNGAFPSGRTRQYRRHSPRGPRHRPSGRRQSPTRNHHYGQPARRKSHPRRPPYARVRRRALPLL